ncbi:MAG: T9SS type A sorting domain-containing protein [Paludibacter sp.]
MKTVLLKSNTAFLVYSFYVYKLLVSRKIIIIFEALMNGVIRLPYFQHKLSKKYLTMKQIILFFMLLFVVFSLSAYDYQTVYSHRTVLFADSTGAIKAMRIDSVKFNVDSIFYPLKNIQQLDVDCFTPYGASWLGHKIIVNEHWNYFFNGQNDTIKIKTDAKLNETWTVYRNTDTGIWATVTKVELLTFLGLTDSVKTIVFYGGVTNSSGVPVKIKNTGTTDFDGKTILLSKKFGLLSTFSFFVLPRQNDIKPYFTGSWDGYNLVGLTNPNVGVQNLTWFDVYDFQVGDEIHVMYNSTPPLGSIPATFTSNIKTIVKYLSRQNYSDSIKYTKEIKQLTNGVEYLHDTATEVILQNNAFNLYPEVPIVEDDYIAGNNNMTIAEFISKSTPSVYALIYKKDETCWGRIMADGCFPNFSYIKGLGGPYYQCYGLFGDSEEKFLVYYKKGSTTWGTPLVISGINLPEVKPDIAIYPNPATDKISISSDFLSEPCIFELMDVRGIVLLRTKVDANENSVNLSNFSKGLYLYRLINKGKLLKTGIIVKL